MTEPPFRHYLVASLIPIFLTIGTLSCTPTIQVAAPAEPITINLNVKIEHEIKIRVDKQLEELFESEDDLF